MLPREVQGLILEALCKGDHPSMAATFPVEVTSGDYSAIFHVSSDALRIGSDDDYVRPIVSHRTLQAAADALGMVVPTAHILSALADQAPAQIDAAGDEISGKRATGSRGTGRDLIRPESASGQLPTSVDVQDEESDRLDALSTKLLGMASPIPGSALNQIGKTWVSSSKATGAKGVNFGFFSRIIGAGSKTPGGWNIIQPEGTAHSVDHTDYSQRGVLMGPSAWVRGGKYGDDPRIVSVQDLATDPATAPLVWGPGGAPRPVRHPGLAPYRCDGADPEGLPSPELPDVPPPPDLPWGASEQKPPKRAGIGWLGALAIGAAAAASWYGRRHG
jgi:hypothetical protein